MKLQHIDRLRAGLVALMLMGATAAAAEDAPDQAAPEDYSLHGQATVVEQYHPSFTSPYRGTNSFDPGNRGDETVNATLFAGIRLWQDLEFYVDPEVDQGFGLSNTVGAAGYVNGQGSKVGEEAPYIRITRAFVRKSIDLGGAQHAIDPDQNQLGGSRSADNLILTIGKFAVTDIFDTNSYAHDPAGDFLNWSLIDAGAFDYAADAWGYSYGAAAEWTQSWWTLRGGVFDMSRVPNGKALVRGFGAYSVITELEERHQLGGRDGKVKLLLYANRGNMADYTAAIRAAAGTGLPPDVSQVRGFGTKPGAVLNAEQAVGDDWGVFARVSLSDGHKEAYEFTEINRSLAAGLSLKGASWDRANDTVGLAGVVNDISADAKRYFAAGGLGILIGDGQLGNPGLEKILETYYSLAVRDGIAVTADYQYIVNPAYNRDRGPISVLGLRLHAEI